MDLVVWKKEEKIKARRELQRVRREKENQKKKKMGRSVREER